MKQKIKCWDETSVWSICMDNSISDCTKANHFSTQRSSRFKWKCLLFNKIRNWKTALLKHVLDLWLFFLLFAVITKNSTLSRDSSNTQDSYYSHWLISAQIFWDFLKLLLALTPKKQPPPYLSQGKLLMLLTVLSNQRKSRALTPWFLLAGGDTHFLCLVTFSQKQELYWWLVSSGTMEKCMFAAYISLLLLSPSKFRSAHCLGF